MTVVLGSNDVAHTTMGIGIEAAGLTLIIKLNHDNIPFILSRYASALTVGG